MAAGTATVPTGTEAVALNACQGGQKRAKPDKTAISGKASLAPVLPAFSAGNTGFPIVGDIGLEPMTPSLSSNGAHVVSLADKALVASPASRCTNRCTETDGRADELARVVALVAQLPGTDADRAGLLKAAVELLGLLGK